MADPFERLDVTQEQKAYIKKILKIVCSDSRFEEKAYAAIMSALTGGPIINPFDARHERNAGL